MEGRLWCSATGRLVDRTKLYRHQCAGCPLRQHRRSLVSYQGPLEATCSCGTTIRPTKKVSFRKMLTEHFRQTRCHQAMVAADREEQVRRLLRTTCQTAARTASTALTSGLPVLGTAPVVPRPPPARFDEAPPSVQALGVSIHRLGARVERWTTEFALRTHPQYQQVVRLMLERTGLARLPDWRYIITHHMDVVEKEVERLYLSGAIPSVEVLVPAVVALFRHIEGYLATLQDGLMVSLL